MKRNILILMVLALGQISACGGGGSSDTPTLQPPPPTGGIGRTGFAYGPITTFGSIVVNGVRYDTSSADFTVNDAQGSQSDLRVGDVVIVKGSVNSDGVTGTADTVSFEDAVTGPVQDVDLALSLLVVMGQTVLVGPDTSFDDSFAVASLEGVAIGTIVEVSGQYNAGGDIIATRIEPKPAGTQLEVHGMVSGLNGGASTFQINDLVVDYGAAMLDNFPGGQIANGDFVEAKGNSLGAANELIATSVELEGVLPAVDDGDFGEIEGFITRFASAQDFDVAGFPVTTDGSTVFEGGTAGDLGLNIKVEAEGSVNSAGVLVATKIDIRRAKAVRATAVLDSVNAGAESVMLLGITVTVDNLTRLEDKSDARVEPLTVADLNAGDYVEVRGDEFPAGSGTILATILERDDPDTETILQGFVESVSDPSLTILGVTIETGPGTVFRDENDAVISSAEFFNRLADNDLVKAQGTETSATVITAEEVEFELEL
jgi:hypothetical protein